MNAEGVATAPEVPLRSVAAAELGAAAALAYAEGYRWYVMCAGVDGGATLEIRHLLRNPETGAELWLSASVDASDPRVASVVPVYAGADWFERETYDMFGVLFTGHPDLRRILLPVEWEGFPLRKSYAIDTACPPYRPAPPPKSPPTLKVVP